MIHRYGHAVVAQSTRPGSAFTKPLLAGGATLLGALPSLVPPLAVIALLACVLVPLPTALVDLLLSGSLAGSVLLLVASLRIRRSSDFLSFPALLLLATLYRLAINISTTRLILSQANAGQVVDAFATVVVRGDLIVGGVMFAIISAIQYLVITGGAQRVAEVAARFALDGLPGHQQSIEADLRAGLISSTEAAQRRAQLLERSSFYGAMDGAIRFVKGDAIAGLVIIGINLVGGLAIGVGRMDLSWSQSFDLFGRLTIGDGLLTQIPALVVSLAAGVLVSRIDRDGPARPNQPWLEPAMLLVPAIMLLGLALGPNMPSLAFTTAAVALVSGALWLAIRVARRRPPPSPAPLRLRVCMHPETFDEPRDLERALAELGDRCATVLGLDLPPMVLTLDPAWPRRRWELRSGNRHLLGQVVDPPVGSDELLLAVFRSVMDHAPTFIDLQTLDHQLELCRTSHSNLTRHALEVLEPVDVLAIIRAFLRERLPAPPLIALLGAIAEDRRFRTASDRPRFAEYAREQLTSYWLAQLLDRVELRGPPRWVRLTPDAEEILEASTRYGELGVSVRLTESQRQHWRETLYTDEAETRRPVVLITSPPIRPAAAQLFAGSTPYIPVLSTTELSRINRMPACTIDWLDAPPRA